MPGKQRIDGEPAFLLHSHPYSETSLVLDIFSRKHGRLPLLARGARRPRSQLRGMLLGFQPLELSWFGGGEVKTLARAEWQGGMPLLSGHCLLLGYYLNELLLKLLPREDAHPLLFDAYADALEVLSRGFVEAAELRRFEKTLLRELGYGLIFDREAGSGAAVQPDRQYGYQVEWGVIRAEDEEEVPIFWGQTLLDMASDTYTDARTLAESKILMRGLIAHVLGNQPLQSRRIFMECQGL